MAISINKVKTKNSNERKLIGIKMDKKLTFKSHGVNFAGEHYTKFILSVELGNF